jgi:REP element-mobilizing transposase RayT
VLPTARAPSEMPRACPAEPHVLCYDAPMLLQPYRLDELEFAYCYRVYLRWRTHRAKPISPLATLSLDTLKPIASRFDIHILEANAGSTEVLLLVSLLPQETISACVSKLKGQLSKWLRQQLDLSAPTDLLSNGYFACTAGQSTTEAVHQYLERQSEHHGYDDMPRPPVFVQTFELSSEDERRISADHCVTYLQHHIVLATRSRNGVFGRESGADLAMHWRQLLCDRRGALVKTSFVPDHVHLAVRVHPTVSPADLILELMNGSQEFMWHRYAGSVLRAGVERLWQPSAYLGSFGDLESSRISSYVKHWKAMRER